MSLSFGFVVFALFGERRRSDPKLAKPTSPKLITWDFTPTGGNI
jgi:hypothetical protein